MEKLIPYLRSAAAHPEGYTYMPRSALRDEAEIQDLLIAHGYGVVRITDAGRTALAQHDNPPDEQVEREIARLICAERCPYDPDGPVSHVNPGPRWKSFIPDARKFLSDPKTRAALKPAGPSAQQRVSERVRHKKRGTEYEVIGVGKMQCDWWQIAGDGTRYPTDMREVTIYRSIDDGCLWVRPREEFEDGRFEAALSPEDGGA